MSDSFDHITYSLPGASVSGFLQGRTLECVAIPFSGGSSQTRDQTWVSYVSCIGRQVLYYKCPPGKPTIVSAAAAKSLQSCPTLCDPIDGSPPSSAIPGILQARTLEWVAIPFSGGSSQPTDQIQVSCIVGRFFTSLATREGSLSCINSN